MYDYVVYCEIYVFLVRCICFGVRLILLFCKMFKIVIFFCFLIFKNCWYVRYNIQMCILLGNFKFFFLEMYDFLVLLEINVQMILLLKVYCEVFFKELCFFVIFYDVFYFQVGCYLSDVIIDSYLYFFRNLIFIDQMQNFEEF